MSKKGFLLAIAVAGLLAACSAATPEVLVVTATPEPATATAVSTNTPVATATAVPSPTLTPEPTISPISIAAIESALRDSGYSRYPFEGEGASGFYWINKSAYEQVTTYDYGAFELEVLHDDAARVRSDHMEWKFEVLDTVFPSSFMEELRREFEAYNQQVQVDMTGDPEVVHALGGEWKDVWAQYYLQETSIHGYYVSFSVWWWQSTCPPQYLYCYYENFPGLEFTGDSSFKFLTIYIEPPSQSVSTDST